jgi:hypothetical protein
LSRRSEQAYARHRLRGCVAFYKTYKRLFYPLPCSSKGLRRSGRRALWTWQGVYHAGRQPCFRRGPGQNALIAGRLRAGRLLDNALREGDLELWGCLK